MRHFTAMQLHERLQQAKLLLLDVREPWEFEYCHIAGSILIPMREIPAALTELNSRQEIIVICHHGIRSRQVAYFLESQGFHDVVNLTGGVDAWAKDVDPQMRKY